jgi:hypothetical protein
MNTHAELLALADFHIYKAHYLLDQLKMESQTGPGESRLARALDHIMRATEHVIQAQVTAIAKAENVVDAAE